MELRDSLKSLELKMLSLISQKSFICYVESLVNSNDVKDNIIIVMDEIRATLKENDLYVLNHYDVLVENYYSLLNFYEEMVDKASWFATQEVLGIINHIDKRTGNYKIFFNGGESKIDAEWREWSEKENINKLDDEWPDLNFLGIEDILSNEKINFNISKDEADYLKEILFNHDNENELIKSNIGKSSEGESPLFSKSTYIEELDMNIQDIIHFLKDGVVTLEDSYYNLSKANGKLFIHDDVMREKIEEYFGEINSKIKKLEVEIDKFAELEIDLRKAMFSVRKIMVTMGNILNDIDSLKDIFIGYGYLENETNQIEKVEIPSRKISKTKRKSKDDKKSDKTD